MERTALIHFLNFWIHEGDLPLRTRVFAITIGQIFAHPMDIAATVVLNRCPSKKMFPKSVPPFSISDVVPSWVHVFSKSTATSSCPTVACSAV